MTGMCRGYVPTSQRVGVVSSSSAVAGATRTGSKAPERVQEVLCPVRVQLFSFFSSCYY